MSFFRCCMCGGTLEFIDSSRTAVCQYCGTRQVVPDTAQNGADNSVKPIPVIETTVPALMKRAFMFLSDGDFNNANKYCEKALDIDCQYAEAYFCKLMANFRMRNESQFNSCCASISRDSNFDKIMAYGSQELKAKVCEYELLCRYNNALNLMNGSNYERAKAAFAELGDYKDSSKKILECDEIIAAAAEHKKRVKEERDRKEYEDTVEGFYSSCKRSAVFANLIAGVLSIPFLLTFFRVENSVLGVLLFIFAIIALIPLVALYLCFLIKALVRKKKIGLSESLTEYGQKIALLVLCAAPFVFSLLSELVIDGFYPDMLIVAAVLSALILMSRLLMFDIKSVYRSRLMTASIILLLCYLLLGGLPLYLSALIAAFNIVVAFVVLSIAFKE